MNLVISLKVMILDSMTPLKKLLDILILME